MPWNTQGGGPWGSGPGPWGGRPGGQQPPDLEELLRRSQERVKNLFPGLGGGGGSRKGALLIAAAAVGIWLASGFYRIQPEEQGVVLRFGKLDRVTSPGLNYHLPWPVEEVLKPQVTRVNRIEVGFRSGTTTPTGARTSTAVRTSWPLRTKEWSCSLPWAWIRSQP